VLGTAIDKYVYLSVNKFYSELFDYSMRISYRQVECVKSLEEIQHIPFRECLRWCGITNDVEVDYTAELPAYTGLGSSASFIVGLLKSLYAFKGQNTDEFSLAQRAIKVEREILKEPVGCQDQVFASFGGFNLIKFYSTDNIAVQRVPMSSAKMSEFEDHLMLFFTGIKRRASDIIKNQIKKVEQNEDSLKAMRLLVDEGYNILTSSTDLEEFGRLLHKSWVLKRSLDGNVSSDNIDKIYAEGLKGGALGGKLLGAGGGGFILFFVPPKNKDAVRNQLHHLTEIPIHINASGSRILNGTHN
ncbi:MAG: GHMP kinase, partial [Nitrososphaerales archaeon]